MLIIIKFLNEQKEKSAEVKYINQNIIQIKNVEINLSGLYILDSNLEIQGDYSQYKTLYRTINGGYQLSNNGSVYVEPEPEPIPEPTLEELKEQKVQEMNMIQQNLILQGTEVQLSNGLKETFTLNTNDQLSLNSLSVKNLEGLSVLPWHPADESVHCKFYSEEDMKKITDTCMNFVTYHVTYFRDLRIYIRSLNSKQQVEEITYGVQIPIEYQSEVLKTLLSKEV